MVRSIGDGAVDVSEVGLALALGGGLREQLEAMAAAFAPVEAAVTAGRGGLTALRVATASLNGSVAAERVRPGRGPGAVGSMTEAGAEAAGSTVTSGAGLDLEMPGVAALGGAGVSAPVMPTVGMVQAGGGGVRMVRQASAPDQVTAMEAGGGLDGGSRSGTGTEVVRLAVALGGEPGAAPIGPSMREGGARRLDGLTGVGVSAGLGRVATAPVMEEPRAAGLEDGGGSAWVAGATLAASAPEGAGRVLRADVVAALASSGRAEGGESGWVDGLPGRERPVSPAVAGGGRGRGAVRDDELAGVMPGAARPGGAAPLPAGRDSDDGGMGGGGAVMLDGRLVGHWLSERMARDAARPGAGATFFDARQSPAWTPSGAA